MFPLKESEANFILSQFFYPNENEHVTDEKMNFAVQVAVQVVLHVQSFKSKMLKTPIKYLCASTHQNCTEKSII